MSLRFKLQLFSSLLVAAIGLLTAVPLHAIETESPLKRSDNDPQPIYFTVSVVWEGRALRTMDIEAIEDLGRQFKTIPLTHFINPAYLNHSPQLATRFKSALNRLVRTDDEVGLYLQPTKLAITAAGIRYRTEPSYWGVPHGSEDCGLTCGGDLAITAYDEKEISDLIAYHKKQLDELGYPGVQSLIAGAWLASQPVLEAAAAQGMRYDFSAVPPSLVRNRLGRFPLEKWLSERWRDITPDSQPYYIATRNSRIAEFGNNAGLVDFVDIEGLQSSIKNIAARHNAEPTRPLFLHFGTHLETAADYLPRMTAALGAIKALMDNGVDLRPLTLEPRDDRRGKPAASSRSDRPNQPRPPGRYFFSR